MEVVQTLKVKAGCRYLRFDGSRSGIIRNNLDQNTISRFKFFDIIGEFKILYDAVGNAFLDNEELPSCRNFNLTKELKNNILIELMRFYRLDTKVSIQVLGYSTEHKALYGTTYKCLTKDSQLIFLTSSGFFIDSDAFVESKSNGF